MLSYIQKDKKIVDKEIKNIYSKITGLNNLFIFKKQLTIRFI
jgi:hypothetical protein